MFTLLRHQGNLQKNNCKSPEAYNYYESGLVRTVYYHEIERHCLLKAEVNLSQRLSDKPHEPWVAVKEHLVPSLQHTVPVWQVLERFAPMWLHCSSQWKLVIDLTLRLPHVPHFHVYGTRHFDLKKPKRL